MYMIILRKYNPFLIMLKKIYSHKTTPGSNKLLKSKNQPIMTNPKFITIWFQNL